jgi:hypothetical protein
MLLSAGCVAMPGSNPEAKAAASAARKNYMACVFFEAANRAAVPEPAETIATAAMVACSAQEVSAFSAIRVDATDDGLAIAVMRRLRDATREGAVGVVVDKRTAIRPLPRPSPAVKRPEQRV